MSAGTGVTHSEANASPNGELHFFQIWIVPDKKGMGPSYEQKFFPDEEKRGRLRLVVSREGRDGSVTVHQDAELWATLLEPAQTVRHTIRPGRHIYLQVAGRAVDVAVGADWVSLRAGDGLAVEDGTEVALTGVSSAEVLVFDLA